MSLTLSEYFGVERLIQLYLEDTNFKKERSKRRLLIYHHGSNDGPNTALSHLMQILPQYGVDVTVASSVALMISRSAPDEELEALVDACHLPSSWCITHFPAERQEVPSWFLGNPPVAPELPSKVLRHVFTLLERAVDLIAVGGVSRKWAAISRSDSLWQRHLAAVADLESAGSTLFMGDQQQEGAAQRALRRFAGGGKRRGYLRNHYLNECLPYPRRTVASAPQCALPAHRHLPSHAHFVPRLLDASQPTNGHLETFAAAAVADVPTPRKKRKKTNNKKKKKPKSSSSSSEPGITRALAAVGSSEHSELAERHRADRVARAVRDAAAGLEEALLGRTREQRRREEMQWQVAALRVALQHTRASQQQQQQQSQSDMSRENAALLLEAVQLRQQVAAGDARVKKLQERDKSYALEILTVRDDIERVYEERLTLRKHLRDTQKSLERERDAREKEGRQATPERVVVVPEELREESELDEQDVRGRLKRKEAEVVHLKSELLRLGDTIDVLSEKLASRVPSANSSEYSKMKSRASRYEKEAKAGRARIADLEHQLEQQRQFFSEDVPEEEDGSQGSLSSSLSLTSPFPGVRLITVEPQGNKNNSLSDFLAKVAKQKRK